VVNQASCTTQISVAVDWKGARNTLLHIAANPCMIAVAEKYQNKYLLFINQSLRWPCGKPSDTLPATFLEVQFSFF